MAARVLVAHDSKALSLTSYALYGYRLLKATNKHEAEALVINDSIDLFVVSIHFDDSRAVELISFIRKHEKHDLRPIVVIRFMPAANTEVLRDTVNGLIKVGSVRSYLELEKDPDIIKKIRNEIEFCLPVGKRAVV
jgi:response regulator RpfG family c-di-GMP phosphodiesterase